MFELFQKNGGRQGYDSSTVHTIIGEESELKGTLDTQGAVRIEGTFEGQLNAQGEVIIGEKARVKANIFGKRVVISGEVTGNIEALAGLEISSTGKVYGDITGDRLIVDEGAVYKGKVNMDIITSKSTYEEEFDLTAATKD